MTAAQIKRTMASGPVRSTFGPSGIGAMGRRAAANPGAAERIASMAMGGAKINQMAGRFLSSSPFGNIQNEALGGLGKHLRGRSYGNLGRNALGVGLGAFGLSRASRSYTALRNHDYMGATLNAGMAAASFGYIANKVLPDKALKQHFGQAMSRMFKFAGEHMIR